MSQAKVERYKEEKRNRKKTMAQEKRKQRLGAAIGCLVGAALIGWAGYSAYHIYENSRPVETIYADLTALNDYINGLDAEAE